MNKCYRPIFFNYTQHGSLCSFGTPKGNLCRGAVGPLLWTPSQG